MEAFVYIWEDTKYGMKYIGAHKGTPDDGYVASSNSFMEIYEARPQDFKRVIVANCDTWKDAVHQETMLCKKLNVAKDPMFYNMHNGDGKFFNNGIVTEETKAKISQTKRNRPWTEAQKLGAKKAGKTRTLKGNGWSNRSREFSELHKKRLSESHKGYKPTSETLKRMSEVQKKIGNIPPNLKGTVWWTNGIECKRSVNCPGNGWKRGRKL